jgi:hypothetical protein
MLKKEAWRAVELTMEAWELKNGVVEGLHASITLIRGQIKVKGRIRICK